MVFPPSPTTPNFYLFSFHHNYIFIVFFIPTPPILLFSLHQHHHYHYHISIFSSATVTYTFLLFSLYQHQHHHISVVSPPPAPSDFYCFPTTTTITTSFPFFPPRHQHHVSKIRRICMRNTILAIQSLLIGSKYNSLKILKFLNCPQILPLPL